ncbi:MAG: hypothetical protein SNJ74_10805 [Fimbriimonadaceae bacterium]
MKKRKSPIALISVLVVFVFGLMIMTVRPPERPPQMAENSDQVTGAPRPAPSKEDLSRMVSADRADGPEPPEEFVPRRPSVLRPPRLDYTPQPNDSSISTHWYRDDSRKANITEQTP